VFDYRHFGHSTGKPRHLIDIPKQLEDWNSALTYVRSRDDVNLERIGLFGTSFSGGHVIRVAAGDDKIWAVISQCPFTSGFRSALTSELCRGFKGTKSVLVLLIQVFFSIPPPASQLQAPYMMFQALRDYFTNSDENPVTLPLADVPGSRECIFIFDSSTCVFISDLSRLYFLIHTTAALMSAHDVVSGYNAIKPADLVHSNQTPARILLSLPFAFPGSYAKDVKCPIFFAICMKDTVAPAGASISYAEKAPKGVVKKYEDMGHFSIYKVSGNAKWLPI